MTDDYDDGPDTSPTGRGLSNVALDKTISKAMDEMGSWDDEPIGLDGGRTGTRAAFWGNGEPSDEPDEAVLSLLRQSYRACAE